MTMFDAERLQQTKAPASAACVDGGVGEGLQGRVHTFVPGEGRACLECTWGEDDYRQLAVEYPCVGGARPEAPPTVAPVTTTTDGPNPTTGSENVAVTVVDALFENGAAEVRLTLGGVPSNAPVRASWKAAAMSAWCAMLCLRAGCQPRSDAILGSASRWPSPSP